MHRKTVCLSAKEEKPRRVGTTEMTTLKTAQDKGSSDKMKSAWAERPSFFVLVFC
jgi:hypothetical protein